MLYKCTHSLTTTIPSSSILSGTRVLKVGQMVIFFLPLPLGDTPRSPVDDNAGNVSWLADFISRCLGSDDDVLQLTWRRVLLSVL